MKTAEIKKRIAGGEDSATQFKREAIGPSKLAEEMVAFSNAEGGVILFGVADDGTVVGLDDGQRTLINRDLSSAANDGVRPAIYPRTEVHVVEGKTVLAVIIAEGVLKPYADKSGAFWMKSGPDKRRIVVRDELQRLLQNSLLIHADEMPVPKTSEQDIDLVHFRKFIRGHYKAELDELLSREGIGLGQLLNNLGLADGTLLTLAGVLLFGKNPQKNHAQFVVKAVSFAGNDSAGTAYRDSEDISGTIAEMYRGTMAFINRNLHHVQAGQDFNSLGVLEISETAVQEIVVNMFMHRDYFVDSPWKVFIFDDRMEIISPGCLPNHLTIEKMKAGVSFARNSTILSFASKELPYRGLGTGVKRAVEIEPGITFESSHECNWLKVVFARKVGNSTNEIGNSTNGAGNSTNRAKNSTNKVGDGTNAGQESTDDLKLSKALRRLVSVIGRDVVTVSEMMTRLNLRSRGAVHATYVKPALREGVLVTVPKSANSTKFKYRLSNACLKVKIEKAQKSEGDEE